MLLRLLMLMELAEQFEDLLVRGGAHGRATAALMVGVVAQLLVVATL